MCMSAVIERIRKALQVYAPQRFELQPLLKPLPREEAVFTQQKWRRLAELLGLDPSVVERACTAQPEWCEWIEAAIEGRYAQAPASAPSLEVVAMIERASQLGYQGLARAVSVKELAKRVADVIRKHGADVVRQAEEAVKLLRNLYGARAEQELFRELRSAIKPLALPQQELESAAKKLARVVFEAATPEEAVKRVAEAAQLLIARAEAKTEQPQLKPGSAEAREAVKPLRPGAEAKRV